MFALAKKKERVFSGPSSSDRLPCRSVRFEDSEREHEVAIHHCSAFAMSEADSDGGSKSTTVRHGLLVLVKIESKQ